ncbi:MAG: glycosyltransferase [Lachnospiraceae bacterium]|jgi:rhamnosyltransferase|nr:glycosyltransferase [Lachnospiraceae bacterium]
MDQKTEGLTLDVIIPTYRPGEKFRKLLEMIGNQTYPIGKIIVVNTEKQYWEQGGFAKYENLPGFEVHHIKKSEFDHGGTRHWAVSFSQADLFLCMTDDAVPADVRLAEELVAGFQKRGPKGEVPAMVYARQLPDRDCGYIERYTRGFNYPAKSRVKTKADIPKLGIKTYFGSNVCCAYNRQIYMAQGGFIRHTIFNEDMIFAGRVIQEGYALVYQAKAQVIHSHNLSCRQQFCRNFDLAVSQADHPEIFAGLPSEGEGIRLVKRTAAYLVKSRRPWLVPELAVKSGFKYLGYCMGKWYQHLPGKVVLWCTMNQNYWKKAGDKK